MARFSTRKHKAYSKEYYKHNREKILQERKVPLEEKKEANKMAYEARAQNTLHARKKKYSLLSEEIKRGTKREVRN